MRWVCAMSRSPGPWLRVLNSSSNRRLSTGLQPATIPRHVNVLEHLFGHLKRVIGPREKREIGAAIAEYRAGRIPLVVPIALLRFLVVAHEVDWVRDQLYLEPHPREMMLRNHV